MKTPRPLFIGRILSPIMLVLIVALMGCNGNQPQVFSTNYRIITTSDPLATVNQIKSGSTRINSLLGSDPCNFSASFESGFAPAITFAGSPGQPRYTILAASANPKNIAEFNPPTCPKVEFITMSIGTTASLDVGETTDEGRFEIEFDNGLDFDGNTSRFFGATLTLDETSPRRRRNGTYRHANVLQPDKLLVGEGTFILRS